ncbi:MAG: zinc ABC transporter substrate-binding protein [Bacterioplanes sp.]|nr:zinc ABC transporter substrate-binding protein [Bacterioplanes sp.]
MMISRFFAFSLFLISASLQAQSFNIMATVHPLAMVAASLVAPDQIEVLIPTGMSPHDFALRPSDIERLQEADVILWNGPNAEPFLQGFAQRWPDKIWLSAAPSDAPANADDHWWFNPHVMLDLQHQLALVLEREERSFEVALQAQLQTSQEALAAVRHHGFFVFHRAYDHWVEVMQLNQVGAFTLSPEQKPGLRTLHRMRQQLQQGEVQCVFSEPQFSPALIDSVTRGLNIRRGELDPMAAHIPLSANAYVEFIADLTERFVACLTPETP